MPRAAAPAIRPVTRAAPADASAVVGLPVVELAPEQPVEVGADGLVGGGQPDRPRPAGRWSARAG